MKKSAELKAEIEKVKNNTFLPEAVRKIKIAKLEAELKKAENSELEADLASHKGGSTTAKQEKTKLKKAGFNKDKKTGKYRKPASKPKEESVYIEFLNKDKNFQQDKKYFTSYETAKEWGKKEFDNFNLDMIKYGENPNSKKLPSKKAAKKSKPSKSSPIQTLIDTLTDINIDLEGEDDNLLSGFRLELEENKGNADRLEDVIGEFRIGPKLQDEKLDKEVDAAIKKYYKNVPEPPIKKDKKSPAKTTKGKKQKVTYQYKGKQIKELTEEDCDELRKDVAARRQKAAKAEKKSKSKPVIEKISGNVAQAVKQAIKNVSAADIKDNPKKEIDKMKLIAIEAKKFVTKIKSILGDDYNASAVKEEFKDIDALIKEIEQKYK